jgi:hypothetical protein
MVLLETSGFLARELIKTPLLDRSNKLVWKGNFLLELKREECYLAAPIP